MWMRFISSSIALLVLVAVASAARYQPTPHGVLVTVGSNQVELAVQGLTAFRISVSISGAPSQIDSPFLETQSSYAPFTVTTQGNTVGIKTGFGAQQIDTTSAAYTLFDASGNTLTSSVLFPPSDSNKDTCANVRQNTDVTDGGRIPKYPDGLSNQTATTCCALCNNEPDCSVWVWADPAHPDWSGKDCWLLENVDGFVSKVGRTSGGALTPPPPSVKLSLGVLSGNTKFFGAGGGFSTVQTLTSTSSNPHVSNTEFFVPHYWSTDGYAALGVSPIPYDPKSVNSYDATWAASQSVTWQIAGAQADLYLMPAASMGDGLRTYWDLTGRPRMLPRYAYGFMASRWGWTDVNYIEQMLTSFRNGSFPIDAWISDFEWYTPQPDYSLPDSGSPTFQDFGYNNITFPQPIDQLKHYHDDLHLRFGGIRKPRLGNTDLLNMARSKGWLASQSAGGSGGARNLNYSIPEVRDWYAQQLAHFLPDGVDFWWNDEGETLYFTFFWWNSAQLQTLVSYNPKKRFFTINRSFTPGMQRLGLVVWTGDIQVSWDSMLHQPAYAASWTLAGAPYVTCDIGGFNGPDDPADLLVRWYQSGVFMPIMRVHSTISDKPHFPFLYGDTAAQQMRGALNLRYQMLPYTYSVASQVYSAGVPLVRPLAFAFPQDPAALSISNQWFFGPSIMATPILTSSDGTTSDTSRSVYLPKGLWYQLRYGSSSFVVGNTVGPATLTIDNVGLGEILFWAPAGAIIPLAPVIQYSGALPGGPLTVSIFPGSNGTFVFVEDDGETTDYETGSVRTTTYVWNDTDRLLSWSAQGTYQDANTFVSLTAVAYFQTGTKQSATQAIGQSGTIRF